MNRRQQIIEVVRRFWKEHGCSPTEREIAAEIGIYQNAVRYHVEKLVKAGELMKITAGHRSLALPTHVQDDVLVK